MYFYVQQLEPDDVKHIYPKCDLCKCVRGQTLCLPVHPCLETSCGYGVGLNWSTNMKWSKYRKSYEVWKVLDNTRTNESFHDQIAMSQVSEFFVPILQRLISVFKLCTWFLGNCDIGPKFQRLWSLCLQHCYINSPSSHRFYLIIWILKQE